MSELTPSTAIAIFFVVVAAVFIVKFFDDYIDSNNQPE